MGGGVDNFAHLYLILGSATGKDLLRRYDTVDFLDHRSNEEYGQQTFLRLTELQAYRADRRVIHDFKKNARGPVASTALELAVVGFCYLAAFRLRKWII